MLCPPSDPDKDLGGQRAEHTAPRVTPGCAHPGVPRPARALPAISNRSLPTSGRAGCVGNGPQGSVRALKTEILIESRFLAVGSAQFQILAGVVVGTGGWLGRG